MQSASPLGTSSANALTFSSPTTTLRVIVRDGEPWFVAADVCAALAIGNSRMALDRLDDDEKGVSSTDTPGGRQEVAVINESGLYSLILGSRKPEAKRLKKWVTAEVLPSIRRTGQYGAPAAASAAGPALSHLQRRVAQLSQHVLATEPMWQSIARYRALGLTRTEIGRLLAISHRAVERHITQINAAGVELPERGSDLRKPPARSGASAQAVLDLEVQHG